ncbi:MAG TPA: TonB-dependent receptor, partial [Oscillatoriaceae cyanobacterium]
EQNWYARTQASQTLNAAMSLDGSLAYSRGGPAGGDLLSVGRTDYNIERLLLAQGWDATGAFNWALGDRSGVTFGADWDRTMQNLPTYLQVFPNGATQPDGPPGGYAQLDNVGAYAQGIYYPMDDLGVTANLRDDQNSVYGNNLSSRLGLVYQVNAAITAKALYGSSFKAPSAPELYGTPLIYGDIVGNPDLKPERANTLEGLVTFSPSSTVDWTSDIYYTHVADKVTFLLQNGNPVAVNLGQLDSAGIESGVDWRWAFLDGFFNTSLQKTVQTTSDGFADPNGEIEPYPYWMANAGIGSPIWHLPLGTFLEARYVGWVPSSQSNFVANGHEAYEIPPAFVVDWTVTSRDLYWNADKETIVSFKIANLFDAQYTQPGYGGVDYPGLGRTFWLDFSQGF